MPQMFTHNLVRASTSISRRSLSLFESSAPAHNRPITALRSVRTRDCTNRVIGVWQTHRGMSTEEQNTETEPEQLQALLDERLRLIEEKTKEASDYKEKYAYSLAEAQNMRKRNEKLVSDSKLYGIQSFSKDLLSVADILEKATESVPTEDLKNEKIKTMYEGVTMTSTELQKVLAKHGIARVDPLGEKFDPNFHEALFTLPAASSNVEAGNVAVVTKVGYRLHQRALRAALVGVAQ